MRPRTPGLTDALWFKNAVISSLDVATFQDSDDDGIGDLRGEVSRNPVLGLARIDRDHKAVHRQWPLKKIARHPSSPIGDAPRRCHRGAWRPTS